MLAYIDDESYRRQISTQLNKHESRHSLARKIFYEQRGELRQRYREGQEDQLGAVGLVLNAIIVWNTRYIQAAIQRLRTADIDVSSDDLRRMSPLTHSHINQLGRYEFQLAPATAAGELRPLRQPTPTDEPVPLLQALS